MTTQIRAGYYVPDFGHKVAFNHHSQTKRGVGGRSEAIKRRNAAMKWCEDQNIEFIWDPNESLWRFRFRTEEDATMFKLAWGC
jgi:hypothetical protein